MLAEGAMIWERPCAIEAPDGGWLIVGPIPLDGPPVSGPRTGVLRSTILMTWYQGLEHALGGRRRLLEVPPPQGMLAVGLAVGEGRGGRRRRRWDGVVKAVLQHRRRHAGDGGLGGLADGGVAAVVGV
jgi:hypothetical protein